MVSDSIFMEGVDALNKSLEDISDELFQVSHQLKELVEVLKNK